MRRLARPDPLILLVGGLVIVLGSLGAFARLGLTADQVAQLEAGLIMIVSSIRIWIERSRSEPASPQVDIRDDPTKPLPTPDASTGNDAKPTD